MLIQATNIFLNPHQTTSRTAPNSAPKYPNLAPLKADTVSFTGIARGVDLLDLPTDKIISICKKAIKENLVIGEGQEAIAIKIQDYPYYCIRQEKKCANPNQPLGFDMKLNKYDKVNHVVAHLSDSTQLLRYVPGIPLKIMRHSDTTAGIKVKEALQELVANNFPEYSFKNAIRQVEDAKSKGIDFDRFGENLLVDPVSQNLTCIDFSPHIHMDEYNPISFLYHAIDGDKTIHAPKILGKLCKAYAQRLTEVPVRKLNLDTLDTTFHARGFEGDPFNYFPDRELLKETEHRIKKLLEAKQDPKTTPDYFRHLVDEFKEFVDAKLIAYKPKSRFSFD